MRASATSATGLIHTDLLAQKLIPDPFYRDNEKKVQWVSDSEWEYRRTLTADQNLLKHKHIDLVFEGLNTLADVSLNGKVIMQTDNMFREWRVDIKTYLQPGSNTLSIVFHRIKPELARLDKAHPEEKDGKDTSAIAKMLDAGNKSYVRKAAYEAGWDWGPNIVTCGIWRPVYLQCWEDERIADLGIQQSDITIQAAHINVDVRVLSTVKANATLKVEYAHQAVKPNLLATPLPCMRGSTRLATQSILQTRNCGTLMVMANRICIILRQLCLPAGMRLTWFLPGRACVRWC